jgi:hypothetical protein
MACHGVRKEATVTEIFDHMERLVAAGSVRISEHGYDELAADNIRSRDVI